MEIPLSAVIIIVFSILLKSFLSLSETAFLASRRTWILAQVEEGNKKYRKVLEVMENFAVMLSALRVGNVFLTAVAGAASGFCAAYIWANIFFVTILASLFVTFTAIILGEIIPQQLALIAPEKISSAMLPFVKCLIFFSRPLNRLSNSVSNLLIKLFKINKDASVRMTQDELRIALIEGEKSGIVESNERDMVEKVFYLGDRPVGTFMTHRSEIIWIDVNSDQDSLKEIVIANKEQNYFPVADGNLDEVIGIVFLQDILLAKDESNIKTIMKKASFIPETMSALKAFEVFKKENANFLFVMDEYGGFAGVISIKDLMTAIIGQSSQTEVSIIEYSDGTYLADGSINIDELIRILSLEIANVERQEFHTLAGFILSLAGEIPQTGAVFNYGNYRFTITNMEGNRINKVLIKRR